LFGDFDFGIFVELVECCYDFVSCSDCVDLLLFGVLFGIFVIGEVGVDGGECSM